MYQRQLKVLEIAKREPVETSHSLSYTYYLLLDGSFA